MRRAPLCLLAPNISCSPTRVACCLVGTVRGQWVSFGSRFLACDCYMCVLTVAGTVPRSVALIWQQSGLIWCRGVSARLSGLEEGRPEDLDSWQVGALRNPLWLSRFAKVFSC
jgi:hypothetical protein